MARRNKKKKKKTSLMGALILEAVLVIAFVALFFQARAERQQEVAGETPVSAVAAWPSLLEETPFQGVVDNARNVNGPRISGTEQNLVYSVGSLLQRIPSID